MFIDPAREMLEDLMDAAQVELALHGEEIRDKAWDWAKALCEKQESITVTEAMYCPQTLVEAGKAPGGVFAGFAFRLAVGEAVALSRGEDTTEIVQQRLALRKKY